MWWLILQTYIWVLFPHLVYFWAFILQNIAQCMTILTRSSLFRNTILQLRCHYNLCWICIVSIYNLLFLLQFLNQRHVHNESFLWVVWYHCSSWPKTYFIYICFKLMRYHYDCLYECLTSTCELTMLITDYDI